MNAPYHGDAFRIVRSACPGCPEERPVIVFQCYLDDSATSGLPVVSMAGFVASVRLWEEMEPIFNGILDHYGVSILHAKQFHDTDGCFKGWRKVKKHTLVEELFGAAHGKVLGLSVTLRKSSFEAEKKKTQLLPNQSAIGICFSSILIRVCGEPQLGASIRRDGVSFLVESGNKNNDEIRHFFDTYAKHSQFSGFLRSLTFIPKTACRAIQLADFFAFYCRRLAGNHDRFDGKLTLPMESYLAIIHKHVPVWKSAVSNFKLDKIGHIDTIDITSLYPAVKPRAPGQSS